MNASKVSSVLFFVTICSIAPGTNFEMRAYEALGREKIERPSTNSGDLRLAIQSAEQLAYLRERHVVLFYIRYPDQSRWMVLPPALDLAEAMEKGFTEFGLKKLPIEVGFYRIHDYPTASVTLHGKEVIFYARPYPRSRSPRDVELRRFMWAHTLEAGDVVTLDLVRARDGVRLCSL